MKKFTTYFNNWEWLKCSTGNWNYARVMGVLCIMYTLFKQSIIVNINITNLYQLIYECAGIVAAVLLFLIEIIRDYKNVSVRTASGNQLEIKS